MTLSRAPRAPGGTRCEIPTSKSQTPMNSNSNPKSQCRSGVLRPSAAWREKGYQASVSRRDAKGPRTRRARRRIGDLTRSTRPCLTGGLAQGQPCAPNGLRFEIGVGSRKRFPMRDSSKFAQYLRESRIAHRTRSPKYLRGSRIADRAPGTSLEFGIWNLFGIWSLEIGNSPCRSSVSHL